MDYVLSVFFNSRTTDPYLEKVKLKKGKHLDQLPFDDDSELYFGPWKWYWRQSDGPNWFETGNMKHPALSEQAALGKLTLRIWNRDPGICSILRAFVIVSVQDEQGHPQKVNSIFAAYKFADMHSYPKPFDDSIVGTFAQPVSEVPGGKEEYADGGDQMMRRWDLGELFFTIQPQKHYNFLIDIFVQFDQPEHRVFTTDPEMDIGLNLE